MPKTLDQISDIALVVAEFLMSKTDSPGELITATALANYFIQRFIADAEKNFEKPEAKNG